MGANFNQQGLISAGVAEHPLVLRGSYAFDAEPQSGMQTQIRRMAFPSNSKQWLLFIIRALSHTFFIISKGHLNEDLGDVQFYLNRGY